ncbi:probable beta-glucosidase [Cephalotrichum gorgonifer]|uniref:beta-glucosidase n=1 Tax=Cephalotrichum gorgonifer TaxID=2041049 RepID=A0AAE8ST93_9PEZI|nr:probable beta-glucosidase [Cephalotrichum gorgonifer]
MDPSKEGLLRPESPESFDSRDPQAAPAPDVRDEHTTFRSRNPRSFKALVALGITCLLAVAVAPILHTTYHRAPSDGQSPPWYPSPRGGTAATWASSYEKAAAMVSRMTLAEKVNITTGTGWRMGQAVGTTGPALAAGFPALVLQDGPLGLRFADNATAFPAGITVGATWDRELMYLRGKAHGNEARLKGINTLLGPCVGPIGRMPAGGRNWEGFGSDPYLQGVAGAETIRGIQSENVMATIKHFVGNEQEHFRQSREWALPNAISSNIDDRTLHEVYAWPFGDAVKAGVASVMCSYNTLNNSYACANSKLLNGILKDEMGFQGFVMSDWLAQRSGVASALAGLDMTMPGDGLVWEDGESLWGPQLSMAVLNGSLPIQRLDDMVTRVVAAWYQLGQDDETLFDNKGPNFSSWTDDEMGVAFPGSPSEQEKIVVNRYVNVQGGHKDIARRVAADGTVLLKNEGVLPLGRDGSTATRKAGDKTRIGIFGEDAGPGDGPNACLDRGCNQGTLASGWGSGAVEFPYLVTPVEALRAQFGDSIVLTESLTNKVDSALLRDQDICIVFANSDAGEGYMAWGNVRGDRNDLFLQKGGDKLVYEVAKRCGGGSGETIVVIHSVGPVVVERWVDLPGVKAVVLANLPGQESGNALADILFGDVNPSGRLPYTMGKSLEDYGEGGQVMYYPNAPVPQQDFTDGVFIDYRHFDMYEIEPRYEFGFGLSYTTFEIRDVVVTGVKGLTAFPSPRGEDGATPPEYSERTPDREEVRFPEGFRVLEKYVYPYFEGEVDMGPYPYPDGYDIAQPPSQAGGGEGGNPDLWETYVVVKAQVTNTGDRAGKVVAQLYMTYPDETEVEVPRRSLRGFEKVYLEAGETREVAFEVTRRDLSYWDVEAQNWRIVDGEYGFVVGESSRGGVQGVWA